MFSKFKIGLECDYVKECACTAMLKKVFALQARWVAVVWTGQGRGDGRVFIVMWWNLFESPWDKVCTRAYLTTQPEPILVSLLHVVTRGISTPPRWLPPSISSGGLVNSLVPNYTPGRRGTVPIYIPGWRGTVPIYTHGWREALEVFFPRNQHNDPTRSRTQTTQSRVQRTIH